MATPRQGYVSRVQIDGVNYICQTWEVDEMAILHDVSNTEGVPATTLGVTGVGYQATLPDVVHARVTVSQATFDDSNNPFDNPIFLTLGGVYQVKIFPVKANVAQYWNFKALVIEDIRHTGSVPGLQPITFTGITDGQFIEPV